MSLTKLDELHESGDGDTHQVPRLCTKSSCQDRTGTPSCKEIDIRLTRNDHFWPAAAPIPRPNPWTPKSKREPSSESFREKGQARNPKAKCSQADETRCSCLQTCSVSEITSRVSFIHSNRLLLTQSLYLTGLQETLNSLGLGLSHLR